MVKQYSQISVSRRKLLAGISTIGVASAGAGLGTDALLSDTESFSAEVTAGTLNLKVSLDIVSVGPTADPSVIAGEGSQDGTQVPVDDVEAKAPFTGEIKTNDDGEETATVTDGDTATGVQITDIKPGDSFVLKTCLLVTGNPAYVRAIATNVSDGRDTGVSFTEPESDTNDSDATELGFKDGGVNATATNGDSLNGTGELDNTALVRISDNNDFQSESTTVVNGTLNQYLNDLSAGQPITFGRNGYRQVEPGTPVCAYTKFSVPKRIGNVIQGDTVSWTFEFQAEQARNNDNPFGDQSNG